MGHIQGQVSYAIVLWKLYFSTHELWTELLWQKGVLGIEESK